jgi:hypothetical protein
MNFGDTLSASMVGRPQMNLATLVLLDALKPIHRNQEVLMERGDDLLLLVLRESASMFETRGWCSSRTHLFYQLACEPRELPTAAQDASEGMEVT